MDNNVSIHKNLKRIREEKGMTQEYVANYLHLSRQAVSRWENGKGYPDIENLILLSKLYEISLDELTQNKTVERARHDEFDSILDSKNIIEFLTLILLLVFSLNIPVVGFLFPCSIMIWSRYTHRKNKIVIILCIICIMIEFYNTFIILNHYFFDFGTSAIQPL